jgi:hydrogenase expression/formation protein HypC
MCLAIPGKILSLNKDASPLMGNVSFGGIEKQVCFDLLPEAEVGQYVVVHVGFALSTMDERAAAQAFEYLNALNESDKRKRI